MRKILYYIILGIAKAIIVPLSFFLAGLECLFYYILRPLEDVKSKTIPIFSERSERTNQRINSWMWESQYKSMERSDRNVHWFYKIATPIVIFGLIASVVGFMAIILWTIVRA